MTTDEEYRSLLRGSLIVTGSCILAVVICYFWVDRSVAFFVYDHHINRIAVFRWLTLPAAGNPELVGTDADRFGSQTGMGTILAMAEGASRRLHQSDRCR